MEQITIIVDDKVGLLADISYLLGKARINIESLSVASLSGKAVLIFYVKDGKKATSVLKANGYRVLESEVLVVRLKDEPGELSGMTAMLAQAKVNILNLFIVAKENGVSILALRVDKPKKAKKLLGPYLNIEG